MLGELNVLVLFQLHVVDRVRKIDFKMYSPLEFLKFAAVLPLYNEFYCKFFVISAKISCIVGVNFFKILVLGRLVDRHYKKKKPKFCSILSWLHVVRNNLARPRPCQCARALIIIGYFKEFDTILTTCG